MALLMLEIVIVLLFNFVVLMRLLWKYWWRPKMMRQLLVEQGIKGPPPRFLSGNMLQMTALRNSTWEQDMEIGDHNIVPRIYPHYSMWQRFYGKRFVFWCGVEPRITLSEPELIKEVLCTQASSFGKSQLQRRGGFLLLGNGLVLANGQNWARRRRIVGPAFHLDRLKGMISVMADCATRMLDQWDSILLDNSETKVAEIDCNYHLSLVTADIISRTVFGGDGEKGRIVLQHLHALQKIFAQSNRYNWLPFSRFIPTYANREAFRLRKNIEGLLWKVIEDRRESPQSHGNDLLGMMLAQCGEAKQAEFGTKELIEECKTFFFTGQETTSVLLSWTLMLLSLNEEWQHRGREEACQLLNKSPPDAGVLNKMKTLGMILNEALRLYPPAPALEREALEDVKLGCMKVAKGTTFWIPVLAIHHNEEIWGKDANEFKPERFMEGSGKNPLNLMPFSMGARACVGQNFAMMEAKLILAMLLQRFKFNLSPNYRHAPVTAITLKPRHGMHLIISRV